MSKYESDINLVKETLEPYFNDSKVLTVLSKKFVSNYHVNTNDPFDLISNILLIRGYINDEISVHEYIDSLKNHIENIAEIIGNKGSLKGKTYVAMLRFRNMTEDLQNELAHKIEKAKDCTKEKNMSDDVSIKYMYENIFNIKSIFSKMKAGGVKKQDTLNARKDLEAGQYASTESLTHTEINQENDSRLIDHSYSEEEYDIEKEELIKYLEQIKKKSKPNFKKMLNQIEELLDLLENKNMDSIAYHVYEIRNRVAEIRDVKNEQITVLDILEENEEEAVEMGM